MRTSLLAGLLGLLALALGDEAEARNADAEACAKAEGELEQVLRACNRAIESGALTDDVLAVTHYNRGNALRRSDRWHDAIADYDRAIALKPDMWGAFLNRGRSFGALGDIPQAIKSFTAALTIKPDHALAMANRGLAYRMQGRFDLAFEDYRRAVETFLAQTRTQRRLILSGVLAFPPPVAARGNEDSRLHGPDGLRLVAAAWIRAFAVTTSDDALCMNRREGLSQVAAACDRLIADPDTALLSRSLAFRQRVVLRDGKQILLSLDDLANSVAVLSQLNNSLHRLHLNDFLQPDVSAVPREALGTDAAVCLDPESTRGAAMEACTTALDQGGQADPWRGHLLRSRANARAGRGRYEEALADMEAALEARQSTLDAWREHLRGQGVYQGPPEDAPLGATEGALEAWLLAGAPL